MCSLGFSRELEQIEYMYYKGVLKDWFAQPRLGSSTMLCVYAEGAESWKASRIPGELLIFSSHWKAEEVGSQCQ